MLSRSRARGLNLLQSLGFVPGLIVALFAVLGIVLVEIDKRVDLDGVEVVFAGDGSAARTVLSVIAGSLITVAGLTFSITMVVLQLASTQFSPRILRTFFGDRVTQVTIGTYVGTFVYSILVLRAVGSFAAAGFVPRLSVTVASLLGIAGVLLLIVFLNHVSRMVQVSHVTAGIARDALARVDVLHPDPYSRSAEPEEADERLGSWRAEAPGRIHAPRPGYVQRVSLEGLGARLDGRVDRVAVLVCPGDFVGPDMAIVEVWPPAAGKRFGKELTRTVSIADERDLDQDVGFAIRQLADIALKAMSPGINDPATAVTCVGYLRSILVRLTERAPLPELLPGEADEQPTVIVRRRRFDEYLESMLQISRYVDGDAWVIDEMLQALEACAKTAYAAGAAERAHSIRRLAMSIAAQAAQQVANDRDRERVAALMARIEATPGA